MTVYRIALSKWAGRLVASGHAARWNSKGAFIIYTAGSRALACLENIVHRRSIGNNRRFAVSVVEIPSPLNIQTLNRNELPDHWEQYAQYPSCQKIGDQWLQSGMSAVLRVPSAIVPEEYNYLLHPGHPDFSRMKIKQTEGFVFDERLFTTD